MFADMDDVEIAWVTTSNLSTEYDTGDVDVIVYSHDGSAAPETGPLPVLYIVDDVPRTPTDLFNPMSPVGVLPSDANMDELRAALSALAAGLSVGAPVSFREGSVAEHRHAEEPENDETKASGEPVLTEREIEVLELVSFGMVNKEIAWELSISDNTVKFHLTSIFAKLDVDNRVSAVRAAVEAGILDL